MSMQASIHLLPLFSFKLDQHISGAILNATKVGWYKTTLLLVMLSGTFLGHPIFVVLTIKLTLWN